MSLEPLLKRPLTAQVAQMQRFNAVALRVTATLAGGALVSAGAYFNQALGEVFHQTVNSVSNLAGGFISEVKDNVDNLAPRPLKRQVVSQPERLKGPTQKARRKIPRRTRARPATIATESNAAVATNKPVAARKRNAKRGGRLYRRNNLRIRKYN